MSDTHVHKLQWWDQFFIEIPSEPAMTTRIQLPKVRCEAIISQVTRNVLLPIDNGIRDVDVVTHSNFTPTMRRKANLVAESQIWAANRLDELKQGFFVVVNVKPMDQDGKDLEWYALGSVLLLKLTGIFHNLIRRMKKQNVKPKCTPLWKHSFSGQEIPKMARWWQSLTTNNWEMDG